MKEYHVVLTLITEAAIDHIIAGLVHMGYSVAIHAKDVSDVSVVVVLVLQRKTKQDANDVAGEIRQLIVDRGLVLLSHVVHGTNPGCLSWGGAIVPRAMLNKLTPPAEIAEKNTPLSRMASILKDDDP